MVSEGGVMLINILRVMITRSFKPFVFQNNNCNKHIDYDVPNLGLYVHVPFCKELCLFCPYYKIKYDASLASKYVDALIKEIQLKSSESWGEEGCHQSISWWGEPFAYY